MTAPTTAGPAIGPVVVRRAPGPEARPTDTSRAAFRRRWYPRIVVGAVVAAFALTVLGSGGADTPGGRLGGDYPAFYGAGRIAAAGDWDELYSADRQIQAQADLVDADGDVYYFSYAPHVAALYRPLAALDYRLSYVLHTLLMAGLVVAAVWVVRPMCRAVGEQTELCIIAALLFYPMLRAVTGGQNTAVSLFLVAAVWRCWHDDRDVLAGVGLALLLFKPQLAIPLLGLALLDRRWRTAGAGLVGAGVLWLSCAAVLGWSWLDDWWRQAAEFADIDAAVNSANAVSFPGLADAILGAGTPDARLVGYGLAALTATGLAGVWWQRRFDFDVRLALAVTGILLLSPHAMYYDTGLLALPAFVLASRVTGATGATGRWVAPVLVACWTLALAHPLADTLGVTPVAFTVLVAGASLLASGSTGQATLRSRQA